MPPLSSLSINQQHAMRSPPPPQGFNAAPSANQFYTTSPMPAPHLQAQPVRQTVHSPAEARIQSWAENVQPQQPKPTPPLQQMWNPELGIKFAGPGANAGGAGSAPNPAASGSKTTGTWDPGSGIRFG